MSRATIARPSLRFLADTLEQFRDRVAAAEIGRRLDLPTSSISRDRKDKAVVAWTFAEVIELARADELPNRAVREFLDDNAPGAVADPKRIATDVAAEIAASAKLHSTVLMAQADGEIDRRERALIRQAVIERQATDAALLADLDAVDQREGIRQ
jgi:hypothetical protein